MISLEGVPSSLILRNESWVRKEAQALVRRLPANVEKADLIQAGLIAVAQAAMAFEWPGDHDTVQAREAFVRYARQRVHGAMLDELRSMDHLSRTQRRQVKLVQVARERWRRTHAREASASELAELCGLRVEDVFSLESLALLAQTVSQEQPGEAGEAPRPHEAATAQDEVEARVDTGMLMRRLETFFARLPERDRRVIDAYLGVGLSPTELAAELNLTTTRISQMFKSVCERIGLHLNRPALRAIDQTRASTADRMDELIAQRETELAASPSGGAWSQQLQWALTSEQELAERYPAGQPLLITPGTRWG